ncbi:YiaA/YiaB family inner membrane protein [Ureibacillus sp. NPDC094379]
MQSKEFFFLTWFAFLVSFSFVLIAIWNTQWMLVEKGFYTVSLGWITFSAFSIVKVLRDRHEGIKTASEYIFLAWLSMVASFSIGMIAVWNTEWQLVEKGYYWMGILFTTYTSIALAKVIRDRQAFQEPQPEIKEPPKKIKEEPKETQELLEKNKQLSNH